MMRLFCMPGVLYDSEVARALVKRWIEEQVYGCIDLGACNADVAAIYLSGDILENDSREKVVRRRIDENLNDGSICSRINQMMQLFFR